MTGDYNAFDSPQKSQTPSRQNSPQKPLPAIPGSAFNALFTTPRKQTNIDFDDSSAGETPRSPERDDSNAPTPENMGFRSTMAKFNLGGTRPQSQAGAGAERGGRDAPIELDQEQDRDRERERPKAKKRDSFIVRLKDKWQSPGRGEIVRTERSQGVSKAIKNKRAGQLQRHVSKKRRHSMSDSDDENELQRNSSPRKTSGSRTTSMDQDRNRPHWVSNLFTFIGQHPTVPHILSFYAQLAFNVFLLAACAYMLYCFWSAVQGDIDKKAFEAMAEVMAESAQCLHSWNSNKCDRATRVPALEKVCEGWEACMNRDATKIGRARVSAHTFAEIFNSFVEPISWKAMVSYPSWIITVFDTNSRHRCSPHSLYLEVSRRQTWPLDISERRLNISISSRRISTFHHLRRSAVSLVSLKGITVHLGIHRRLWSSLSRAQ